MVICMTGSINTVIIWLDCLSLNHNIILFYINLTFQCFSLIPPSSYPSLPVHATPDEHSLSETEAQKLCSHVSKCSSQASHRREDTRSLLDDCKKQKYDLEKNRRKHSNSPPKAIVTPLKTHSMDSSESMPSYSSSLVYNTRPCYSKTLTSTKAICDLKSSTPSTHSVDGWKNLLEAKDKMLAHKNHLIER